MPIALAPGGAREAAVLLSVHLIRCCNAIRAGEAPPPIEMPVGTDEECAVLAASSIGEITSYLGLTDHAQRLALIELMVVVAILVSARGPELAIHLHQALYPPAGTA